MADKTARGEQEQTTTAEASGVPGAPETTPQQALNESKEAGTGGSYVAPAGAEGEGAASQVFEIAVLPLQQTTMFPGTVIPLAAGRPRSVTAVEATLATEEKLLACITVREARASAEAEATPPADLYEAGTLVMV